MYVWERCNFALRAKIFPTSVTSRNVFKQILRKLESFLEFIIYSMFAVKYLLAMFSSHEGVLYQILDEYENMQLIHVNKHLLKNKLYKQLTDFKNIYNNK